MWNIKVTVIPLIIGALGSETGGLGNKRTRGDHPNYSIIEIGQNTEESPGDLSNFDVTQTRRCVKLARREIMVILTAER